MTKCRTSTVVTDLDLKLHCPVKACTSVACQMMGLVFETCRYVLASHLAEIAVRIMSSAEISKSVKASQAMSARLFFGQCSLSGVEFC